MEMCDLVYVSMHIASLVLAPALTLGVLCGLAEPREQRLHRQCCPKSCFRAEG